MSLEQYLEKNKEQAYEEATKNTTYNTNGQAVITKDDEWRSETEWDDQFSELKEKAITSFRDEYYFLSNMYPCDITYAPNTREKEITYLSVESAFQAAKCENKFDRIQFKDLDGYQAKRLGRKIKLRSDWEDIKVNVMLECVRAKFKEEELKQKLLATGDAELIEGNTWGDRFWGVCDGKGKNYLGKILMQVRLELKEGE